MRRFVVPQFIEVESKILGSITARQFIELLIGGGIAFLAYRFADFALFLFIFVIDATLTFFFAFIKINGMPAHYLVLNVIQTFRKPRLRIWNKWLTDQDIKDRLAKEKEKPEEKELIPEKERLTKAQLTEIALIVDTGGVYKGEKVLSKASEE